MHHTQSLLGTKYGEIGYKKSGYEKRVEGQRANVVLKLEKLETLKKCLFWWFGTSKFRDCFFTGFALKVLK